MSKIIFTIEQIDSIKNLYSKGYTITEIANRFNVSYSLMNMRMHEWGIPIRRKWAKSYRKCRGCNQTYSVTKEFFYHQKDYLCKECAKKKSRTTNIFYSYGITRKEYKILLETQGGVCAICNNPNESGRELAVDHDHLTGNVRGLLCLNCNSGLGYFRDDPEILNKAKEYLSSNRS